jgi:DNA-binding NtrC family response regulator
VGGGTKLAREILMIQEIQNEAAGAAVSAPRRQDAPPLILVVDDTQEVREIIALILMRHGYRTLLAEDGLEAERLLFRERPALIISDLRMPRGDGWQLLAFCHEHHPHIPVIIVSAEPWGRRPELEAFAAAYLAKPFGYKELYTEVARFIRHDPD